MENHIKKIFENSGRSFNKDNRSFQTKAVNECIEGGMVKVDIQEVGKVWRNNKHRDANGNLKDFNIQVIAFGFVRRVYERQIGINEILMTIGMLLNDERIKAKIGEITTGASYSKACACSRCNGVGVIPQYDYYCQGICFKCYGAGYEIKKVLI